MPVYSNYFYYYITDILGFSNFQYSMLNVVGSLALLISMYFYNLWFKDTEASLMLGICCIINSLGGVNAMLLIRGFSFGMDPKVFVFLTTTVTDTLQSAIRLLAGNVLFAKLVPGNIEASMFSIFTGIYNFCYGFLAKQLANWINVYVGVNDDNLSRLWVLEAISAGCAILPIAVLWLVPRRKEVFKYMQV